MLILQPLYANKFQDVYIYERPMEDSCILDSDTSAKKIIGITQNFYFIDIMFKNNNNTVTFENIEFIGEIPYWKSLVLKYASECSKKPSSFWFGLTTKIYTKRGMKFDENAIINAFKNFWNIAIEFFFLINKFIIMRYCLHL